MKKYGVLELTVTSPVQSFTEPIDLDAIRHYLRLEIPSPTDSEEDDLLNAYIAAAREVAETFQNRDLVSKQWDLVIDEFPDAEISLRVPLSTVDLVQYKDSDGATHTMTEDTDYIVDTARGIVMPAYGETWPSFTAWPSGAVTVRFTSGYAATDAFWANAGKRILTGMKLLIGQWYENRENVVAGQMSELPFAVTALFQFGANNSVI